MRYKQKNYARLIRKLSPEDRGLFAELCERWQSNLGMLSPHDRRAMLNDLKGGLVLLCANGVAPSEAARRLSEHNLGRIYSRPRQDWYPLDTAAKIYPLAVSGRRMAVFRLSVYLKKPIIPELLQLALDFTLRRFPHFATGVRCGFYWHYLDAVYRRPRLRNESTVPCQRINMASSGAMPFRVSFFGERISAEFFHLLTDGSGGMVFLKTLTAEYLRLCGERITEFPVWETPLPGETDNDFLRLPPASPSGFSEKTALRIDGRITRRQPSRVLHFELDADALHFAAKARGCSVTVFVLSLLFMANAESSSGEGRIQIQVPINLRPTVGSVTLRNFSLYATISVPRSECTELSSLIPRLAGELAGAMGRDSLEQNAAMANKLVRSLRFIPLAVKRPVVRLIYGQIGEAVFSNTLSNLGRVSLPESMRPHIEKFDFVLGPSGLSKVACGLISYEGRAVLTVTKATDNASFEEALGELLEGVGLEYRLSGSV
ncbi:MAG: hypothetical protein IKM04_04245 [Clostridia bacterium]|nr:hypothetical protein [Clostridia bacterium]